VSNGEKKRLLVVDDEKPIQTLLARIAQRAGFEVDVASDGVEALEKLAEHDYAIAIVDLMMPRLSGYELVQKISTLDSRPVVLVATAMANSDVAALDDSMVRSVIKKPFDINAVAKALVDTAKAITDREELSDKPIPIAPPEVAVIPVIVEKDPSTPPATTTNSDPPDDPLQPPKRR
jgi:DNA-binding response OmpR family regulator